MKKRAYVRKGSSQPTGPRQRPQNQPSSLQLTHGAELHSRAPQTENRRPTNRRCRNTSPRPPSLKPSHLCELELKTQKPKTFVCNVCLGHDCKHVSMHHCNNEVQNKSNCLGTPSLLTPENNHATSSAFIAAFTMPPPKVVLYLAVSDQFTSFMAACWLKHLHCTKRSFMIITNG